ncbi:MAG TPA: hypothetical protein VKV20_06360 [Ktedonobacteraceae bacterium]|jgi:hypothetical protein|nr:hypothetical protein [Ktedonobacteraceae bacterium]
MTQISDSPAEKEYAFLASLPLSEAAVVLDVRHDSDDSALLLTQLNTELDDLTAEMRAHNVTQWSHLRDCVALLRLDALPGDLPAGPDTRFVVTLPDGQEQPMRDSQDLTTFLGSECIDRVRNARLNVPGVPASVAAMEDVRQSTVRVFLLADMREAASLRRAATYASWLKAWCEQEHGRSRHHRDARIHTVVLCLNVSASYQDVLFQTLGRVPDSAIDTVILLQKYSDQDAAFSESAQLFQAQLLLYALILRWPAILWRRIDDPIEMHPRFVEAALTLPWPTYLIGLAAFEYSARWSARWLDYSVIGSILKTLFDSTTVEQDRASLVPNIHKWLDTWRRDLREIVPDVFSGDIDELHGIAYLSNYARSTTLSRGKLLDVQEKLAELNNRVGVCYSRKNAPTLQRALEQGPGAVLEQLRWFMERFAGAGDAGGDDRGAFETHYRLFLLYQKLQRFLGLHFQHAEGAVPRALCQLAAFNTYAQQTIAAEAQRQIRTENYRQQFERAVKQASTEIAAKFQIWHVPFFGKVFRSTVISWLIALVIGAVLLFGINWQGLLPTLLNILLPSFVSLLVWMVRPVLILLVLAGECLYLSMRDRSMRRYLRAVEGRLGAVIAGHLTSVGDSIAARVALALLEKANLYSPNKACSPYEERVLAFAQAGRRAEERARFQQRLAEMRLRVECASSGVQTARDLSGSTELIDRSHIEEAFLKSYQALRSNPVVDMLAEMLLRQLGTERPGELLEDIWQKQRWIASKDRESRFQVVSLLLVAQLLVSPVMPPHLSDVLSILQEYTALKARYLPEPLLARGEFIELQTALKNTLVARARGSQRALTIKDRERQGLHALITWIGAQHEHLPELEEIFTHGDVLERLLLSRMQPLEAVDALYQKAILLGYPDEVLGEDEYYLFIAPGAEIASATFMQALEHVDYRRLHVMEFPDREKLIYLRVHQVHQIFAPEKM